MMQAETWEERSKERLERKGGRARGVMCVEQERCWCKTRQMKGTIPLICTLCFNKVKYFTLHKVVGRKIEPVS